MEWSGAETSGDNGGEGEERAASSREGGRETGASAGRTEGTEGMAEALPSARQPTWETREFLLKCLRQAGIDVEIIEDIADACEVTQLTTVVLAGEEIASEKVAEKLFLTDEEAVNLISVCREEVAKLAAMAAVTAGRRSLEDGGGNGLLLASPKITYGEKDSARGQRSARRSARGSARGRRNGCATLADLEVQLDKHYHSAAAIRRQGTAGPAGFDASQASKPVAVVANTRNLDASHDTPRARRTPRRRRRNVDPVATRSSHRAHSSDISQQADASHGVVTPPKAEGRILVENGKKEVKEPGTSVMGEEESAEGMFPTFKKPRPIKTKIPVESRPPKGKVKGKSVTYSGTSPDDFERPKRRDGFEIDRHGKESATESSDLPHKGLNIEEVNSVCIKAPEVQSPASAQSSSNQGGSSQTDPKTPDPVVPTLNLRKSVSAEKQALPDKIDNSVEELEGSATLVTRRTNTSPSSCSNGNVADGNVGGGAINNDHVRGQLQAPLSSQRGPPQKSSRGSARASTKLRLECSLERIAIGNWPGPSYLRPTLSSEARRKAIQKEHKTDNTHGQHQRSLDLPPLRSTRSSQLQSARLGGSTTIPVIGPLTDRPSKTKTHRRASSSSFMKPTQASAARWDSLEKPPLAAVQNDEGMIHTDRKASCGELSERRHRHRHGRSLSHLTVPEAPTLSTQQRGTYNSEILHPKRKSKESKEPCLPSHGRSLSHGSITEMLSSSWRI